MSRGNSRLIGAGIFLVCLILMGLGAIAYFAGVYVWRKIQQIQAQHLRPEIPQEAIANLGVPEIPANEIPYGIRSLFDDFAREYPSSIQNLNSRFFNKSRIAEQLNAILPGDGLPKYMLDQGVDQMMIMTLMEMDVPQDWGKAKINGLRWHREGEEGVLLTRHFRTQEGKVTTPFTMRWWVTNRDGKWKFYDFELTLAGLRASAIFSNIACRTWQDMMFKDPWRASVLSKQCLEFEQIVCHARDQDWSTMKSFLEITPDVLHHTKRHALICYWRSQLVEYQARIAPYSSSQVFDNDEIDPLLCLKCAEKALEIDPDLVGAHFVKAQAYARLKKPEAAIRSLRIYMDQAGPTGDAHSMLGDLLGDARQTEEAIKEWHLALDEQSDNFLCLNRLRVALPKGRKDEFVRRFEKLNKPEDHYLMLFDDAFEDNDIEAAEELTNAFVKRFPNDGSGPLCQATIELHYKRLDQAVAKLTMAYDLLKKQVPALDEQRILAVIFSRFCDFHDPDVAYSKLASLNRRGVFRQLVLLNSYPGIDGYKLDVRKEASARSLQRMNKLIGLHQAADSNDPWLHIAKGEVNLWAGDHTNAEKEFIAALKDLKNDADLAYLKWRRIDGACHAGKGIFAYESVDSTPDTFETVAYFLSRTRKFDELAKLITVAESKEKKPPELELWQAHLCWFRKDFNGAVRRYSPFFEPGGEMINSLLLDRYIRSLLRSGQNDKAREVMNNPECKKNWPSAFLEAIIAANEGDAPKLEEELVLLVNRGYGTPHYDVDLGPMLRTKPAFKYLLEKYPVPKDFPKEMLP